MPGLTQRDWQNALDVQSCINLSGAVHSLSEVMPRIRQEPDCNGTDYVNEPPIVVLYVAQMVWLSMGAISPDPGRGRLGYTTAYARCMEGAKAAIDSAVQS